MDISRISSVSPVIKIRKNTKEPGNNNKKDEEKKEKSFKESLNTNKTKKFDVLIK